MNTAVPRRAVPRHPWLAKFESAPAESLGDLLAGYAEVHPYDRMDAPDAAHMLFAALADADSARRALGPAIVSWLERCRRESHPSAPAKLQRRAREICEAFEIVALLRVADAAVEFRHRFVIWNEWVAGLALSPARDARAEYWRMLALTQPLVASAKPQLNPWSLAPLWQEICREAGGRFPPHYLDIGLLGLRCLPEHDAGSEVPWLSGLAQWALARKPSEAEFKAAWLALKPLYPRAPQRWRKLIVGLLSTERFVKAGVKPPAWWSIDLDFAPMTHATVIVSDALRSPLPKDCSDVIAMFAEPFERVAPRIDRLMKHHRRFLRATGDSQFMVRAIHQLGEALIKRGGDKPHRRAAKAEALAREGLDWQPYDPYLWTLWRDALTAEGALHEAEMIGWEFVRRMPDNPYSRTELATLLAGPLNRPDEAEALLKETIAIFPDNPSPRDQLATLLAELLSRPDDAEALLKDTIVNFPDNPVARNQLAELLIAQDRISEARAVVDALFSEIGPDAYACALRARLYFHDGRAADALAVVKQGRSLDPSNPALRNFEELLELGKPLRLTSATAIRAIEQRQLEREVTPASDPGLVSVLRLGEVRKLRFELGSDALQVRHNAITKLRTLLHDDPGLTYAALLAARQRERVAGTGILLPFAVAFEEALATEDRAKLDALAYRHDRLDSLILVARALFGDSEAAKRVESWLRQPAIAKEDRTGAMLRAHLRPVLTLIQGGRSASAAFSEKYAVVLRVLHDANEASLGSILLAA